MYLLNGEQIALHFSVAFLLPLGDIETLLLNCRDVWFSSQLASLIPDPCEQDCSGLRESPVMLGTALPGISAGDW